MTLARTASSLPEVTVTERGSLYRTSNSAPAGTSTEGRAKSSSRTEMWRPSWYPRSSESISKEHSRAAVSIEGRSSHRAGHITSAQGRTNLGPPQVSGSSTATTTSKRSISSSFVSTSGLVNNHSSSNHSSASGLSPATEKAVIATTIIGAAFVVALLIYFLRKRRRSRQNTDTTPLRPPSINTFLSSNTWDANLTALPMHRGRRNRLANADDSQSPIPARLRDLYSYDPSLREIWKSANPPTPTAPPHPFEEDADFDTLQLRPPEMAQVSKSSPTIHVAASDEDDGDVYPPINESIYAPSIVDIESGLGLHHSHSQRSLQQTPHKSRESSLITTKSRLDAKSLASTISSLPGIRTVREWVNFQPEALRRVAQMREGEAGPSRANSVAFLKNKATKPNLSPVSTRGLSVRRFRRESALSAREDATRTEEEVVKDVEAGFPEDGVIT